MTNLTHEEQMAASAGAQAKVELRQTEQAFDAVRQGLFTLIEDSKVAETVIREQAYAGLSILNSVRAALFAVASSADVAEHSSLIRDILAGKDQAEG